MIQYNSLSECLVSGQNNISQYSVSTASSFFFISHSIYLVYPITCMLCNLVYLLIWCCSTWTSCWTSCIFCHFLSSATCLTWSRSHKWFDLSISIYWCFGSGCYVYIITVSMSSRSREFTCTHQTLTPIHFIDRHTSLPNTHGCHKISALDLVFEVTYSPLP